MLYAEKKKSKCEKPLLNAVGIPARHICTSYPSLRNRSLSQSHSNLPPELHQERKRKKNHRLRRILQEAMPVRLRERIDLELKLTPAQMVLADNVDADLAEDAV